MLAFGMPGPAEWGVILLLVIFFFGAGKLPDVLSEVGRGLRSFRKAATEGGEEDASSEPPRHRLTQKD